MAIKKIKISNFKSFKNLEVELGNFNVLIGANASGKSNFVQIFKFLSDITKYGLDNAISMQGGVEYLRNINIGSSEDFSLEVTSNTKYKDVMIIKENFIRETYETTYKFIIRFKKIDSGFEHIEEKLTQRFNLFRLTFQKNKIKEKKLGEGESTISNMNGKVKVDSLKLSHELPIKGDDILPLFLIEKGFKLRNILLISSPFWVMPSIFKETSIYDFDPKLPKKATPITGKAELEEDGNNLAIALKNIVEDKNKERKFCNLVRDLLPFVDTLDVEKFADKSLLFKLQEIYTKKQPLPASLISDGTINITALIIALYFEKKLLTIIEEPERNIHPYLISKIVGMMKEVSQRKQVIATTHNPEIVKHAGMENILLISRDKDGFSNISRPSEKEEIKTFLKNDLGIEDLYVQNVLGV